MNSKTVVTVTKDELIELIRKKLGLPDDMEAKIVQKTERWCVDQWRNEYAQVFAGIEVTFEKT